MHAVTLACKAELATTACEVTDCEVTDWGRRSDSNP